MRGYRDVPWKSQPVSFSLCSNQIRCLVRLWNVRIWVEFAQALPWIDEQCESGKRLEPIITSHLPSIRLHTAPEDQLIGQLHGMPRAELAKHNYPHDLWISVGEYVYDITVLSKFHPGGEKILMARAGRSADDLFHFIHGESIDVVSMLQNMIVA